jgi:nucleoside-diphosphate-sugar epimerase
MKVLVLGAGGFIGSHLVKRLKDLDRFVVGVDLKYPAFSASAADLFIKGDLRDWNFCQDVFNSRSFDEVYQLAADMGGAGYLFTGENDYTVMHSSAQINLNCSKLAIKHQVDKVFFASSACVYPTRNQLDPTNPICSEDSVYPADPDSEYGWEKLFSERLYLNCQRNFDVKVRIARFHNIYGPEGTWQGGKEKVPAAICRKVASATNQEAIDIWGSGKQTRSFLYIEDCLDGIEALMRSKFTGPVNIGSEEMVSINQLAKLVISISGKRLKLNHIAGPVGVEGRNSNNQLAEARLGWSPKISLKDGLMQTYQWIGSQVNQKARLETFMH